VRVLTWNVARRVSCLAEQAAAISARGADVIALQEITPRTLPLWRRACAVIGLGNVLATLDSADPLREPVSRRRTGVLVAARAPLRAILRISAPWPETVAGALIGSPLGPVEVHCAHAPNANNGWVKIETLESIRAGLTGLPPAPRIVCGDLNTPRRELPDGTVVSFARDHRGSLRPERGARWDEGELGVVPGLQDLGYRDAFRTLHGYARREPSWTWRQRAGHDGGWRLDHLFATSELRPVRCVYHHEWRDSGLSDHSALEADFELALT